MLKTIIFIGLGGGIGSIIRYLISLWIGNFCQSKFPWSTLIINVVGCLIMGILFKNYILHQNESFRYFFMIGLCGGFTTFSAFAMENILLIQTQQWLTSISYIFLSVVLCLLFFILGCKLI